MEINTFEELIEAVKELNNHLKQPEHGLIMWNMRYAKLMQAISDYWVNN